MAVIILALLSLGGVVSLPYLDALGFIIRAADIPGTPATVAGWRKYSFARQSDFTMPTRSGEIPARVYKPEGRYRRTCRSSRSRRRSPT